MDTSKTEKVLYTVQQASIYTGFSKQTFYEWIFKRKIEYVKIFKRVFIKKSTLDELIESNTVKPREVRHA